MKTVNYFLLLVLALALAIPSCKKDKEKSAKEILTSKSWKISSMKLNGTEVITDLLDPCDMDNYMTFTSDGNYTEFVNTIKCDVSETDITGTWSLSEDGKTFTLDGMELLADITEARMLFTLSDSGNTLAITFIPK